MVSTTHRTAIAFLLLSLFTCTLPAQEQAASAVPDTSASVPALRDFHTVIFKLWHTAWPNKDYSMLIELVPDVRKGADDVAAASLPGILREKEAAWKSGVKRLKAIVSDYVSAGAAHENQKLLDAAEKLHAQYEALVRIIRPSLKELESFHATLYLLYHSYLPQDSLAEIKSSVQELKVRMEGLSNAVLPSRFKGKEEAFDHARAELGVALNELAAKLPSNDLTAIKPAVERMHERYEALAKVLE